MVAAPLCKFGPAPNFNANLCASAPLSYTGIPPYLFPPLGYRWVTPPSAQQKTCRLRQVTKTQAISCFGWLLLQDISPLNDRFSPAQLTVSSLGSQIQKRNSPQALMIPLRIAYRTSSALECMLSFRMMFSRWRSTVFGLITSSLAILSLFAPSAR